MDNLCIVGGWDIEMYIIILESGANDVLLNMTLPQQGQS